jgi:hypothetical protein
MGALAQLAAALEAAQPAAGLFAAAPLARRVLALIAEPPLATLVLEGVRDHQGCSSGKAHTSNEPPESGNVKCKI